MMDNEVMSLLYLDGKYSRKERKARSILPGPLQEALQRTTYISTLKDE